ncbi:hypothetical protein GS483_19375 [Rhodococcus hoagii]|nr:hypothetical protein [Prescottella equi]
MTATLAALHTLHPHLEHRERHALTSLGVDLEQPGIMLELQWDTSWLGVDTAPDTNIPVQWFATYHLTEQRETGWGRRHIEHGPDVDETSTEHQTSGLLTQLGEKLREITALDNLDPAQGVTVEINGWALHVAGLLA